MSRKGVGEEKKNNNTTATFAEIRLHRRRIHTLTLQTGKRSCSGILEENRFLISF